MVKRISGTQRQMFKYIYLSLRFFAIFFLLSQTMLHENLQFRYCLALPHADADVIRSIGDAVGSANEISLETFRAPSINFIGTKLWRTTPAFRNDNSKFCAVHAISDSHCLRRARKFDDATNFTKTVFINLSLAARALSFRSIVIEDMDDYVNRTNSVPDKSGKRTLTRDSPASTFDS